MKITVKTFFGLEEVLKEELQELGYNDVKLLNRAVQIVGTWCDVYRLNAECRCAISVLVEVANFKINNQNDLYRECKQIKWSDYFHYKKTFSVKGAVKSTIFKHTQYPFLVVKDAIVDHFKERIGKRPNVDLNQAQVVIDIHISEKSVTVSLNTSGQPLYMRGYRQHTGEAPLNEVLVAAMLRIAKWRPEIPLIDPFCGSGTILIEAALIATNTPATLFREQYAFQNLLTYNEQKWKATKNDINSNMLEFNKINSNISGGDIDRSLVFKTKRNLNRFPFGRFIEIQQCSFEQFKIDTQNKGMLVCNPPYGQRLNAESSLYEQLGTWMKHNLKGFDCWILSGSEEGLKSIGLKPNKKIKLFNGSLKCSFRHYSIY